jgi:hypothetical protein
MILIQTVFFSPIRTCYQSKSFTNLQQLKRKPMLKAFESLTNANFTLIARNFLDCFEVYRVSDEKGLPW